MCGIAGGYIPDGVMEPERRSLLAYTLGLKNVSRGRDSWSISTIKNGEISIVRGLGEITNHAHHFIGADVFMMHTRLATRGAKTVENAHMFEIGNIVGAHNGQISNYAELEKKYADRKKFEVDSQHIFAHLDENLPFDELEGYGAIEWVRRDALDRIYLSKLRNGSLGIWAIGDPAVGKPKAVIWSSDPNHLLEACYACGIKDFFPYKVEEGATYFVTGGEAFVANTRKLELKAPGTTTGRYNQGYYGHAGYPGGYSRWDRSNGNSGVGSAASSSFSSGSSDDAELEDWKAWQAFCKNKQSSSELASSPV